MANNSIERLVSVPDEEIKRGHIYWGQYSLQNKDRWVYLNH